MWVCRANPSNRLDQWDMPVGSVAEGGGAARNRFGAGEGQFAQASAISVLIKPSSLGPPASTGSALSMVFAALAKLGGQRMTRQLCTTPVVGTDD